MMILYSSVFVALTMVLNILTLSSLLNPLSVFMVPSGSPCRGSYLEFGSVLNILVCLLCLCFWESTVCCSLSPGSQMISSILDFLYTILYEFLSFKFYLYYVSSFLAFLGSFLVGTKHWNLDHNFPITAILLSVPDKLLLFPYPKLCNVSRYI